jgi:hypothetical protein
MPQKFALEVLLQGKRSVAYRSSELAPAEFT